MNSKEYLETTFPDGTPVKIYPGKGLKVQGNFIIDDPKQEQTESIKVDSFDDKIVAYDHTEGYTRPIIWREYKTMFAKLIYNEN